jgi:hypothetical protein
VERHKSEGTGSGVTGVTTHGGMHCHVDDGGDWRGWLGVGKMLDRWRIIFIPERIRAMHNTNSEM